MQGGRLIGGWEDNPFKGELQIVLRGNHSTPEWAFPEGPNQGSKVLGMCFQTLKVSCISVLRMYFKILSLVHDCMVQKLLQIFIYSKGL